MKESSDYSLRYKFQTGAYPRSQKLILKKDSLLLASCDSTQLIPSFRSGTSPVIAIDMAIPNFKSSTTPRALGTSQYISFWFLLPENKANNDPGREPWDFKVRREYRRIFYLDSLTWQIFYLET